MMKAQSRKRRTREHIIADLSVNHVERYALLCGFTLERFTHDYGIDLRLFTYGPSGELEDGNILFQMKASDKILVREGLTTFSFRIDRRDLVGWLAQTAPVLLIVYEARNDTAYWVYLQSHFRKRAGFNLFTAGKTVTVKFPITNIVNVDAIRRFAHFRDRVLAQKPEVIHEED